MSQEMLHHAEVKYSWKLLYMFELVWIWNLVWIWIENTRENKIEKKLEILRKKRKPIQPKPPQSSPDGPRACPRHLTGGSTY
jgi:hypothetical protein